MKTRITIALILLQCIFYQSLIACTTFILKDSKQIVFGRNFDFPIGDGFIINNLRGIDKYAFVQDETQIMTWTSIYGSITFNQFGKEFPYGGMNEEGLVIAQMYLEKTKYPEKDERKVISVLQWIQYQLDVHRTVDDVIASDSVIRISNSIPIGIHFLICDSEGNMATIEFINGQMEYHKNDDLTIPLLTNNTYEESLNYLEQFDLMKGVKPVPWQSVNDIEWTTDNTLTINKVFATAANTMNKEFQNINLCNKAFKVLESVTIDKHTKWSTVFDITNKTIHFKNENRTNIISLNLNDFDFSTYANSITLDIQSAKSENLISQFRAYNYALNYTYIKKTFSFLIESGFFPSLPENVIKAQAKLPDRFNENSKTNM